MYSQQPANVPNRLQSNSANRRKPRLSRKIAKTLRTKALSFGLAILTVVLSLSTGIFVANAADKGMEVGFEPEYQSNTEKYSSDNVLFEQYENALCVSILLYGAKEITVYSQPVTVGELLSKLSMTLNENDVASAELDAQITDGMQIKIDRVEVKEVTETSEIPFTSKKVENDTLAKGKTRVKQEGVNGVTTVTIEEKYINGELVSSEKKSEETTTEPVEEIIEVGTYVAPAKTQNSSGGSGKSSSGGTAVSSDKSGAGSINSELAHKHSTSAVAIQGKMIPDESGTGGVYIDSKGNSYRYLYYIDCIATAYGYSAGSKTATGKSVGKGLMAVDPKLIPYHTRCYVTGSYGDMGVQVAEDCGNFRGNWIDLFLGDDATCRQFGKRSMRVFVLG